jgi:hypothetical protein
MSELDLTDEKVPEDASKTSSGVQTKPFDLEENREGTRGDLARGLLYLLTFAIGGVLVFIGSGRLEGTVLTQSIFPSLIALAGTALGFYFGSQANNGGVISAGKATPSGSNVPGSRSDQTG